jgi:hypothetical protein
MVTLEFVDAKLYPSLLRDYKGYGVRRNEAGIPKQSLKLGVFKLKES